MICVINKHRETGLGKSKKLAKRQVENLLFTLNRGAPDISYKDFELV